MAKELTFENGEVRDAPPDESEDDVDEDDG